MTYNSYECYNNKRKKWCMFINVTICEENEMRWRCSDLLLELGDRAGYRCYMLTFCHSIYSLITFHFLIFIHLFSHCSSLSTTMSHPHLEVLHHFYFIFLFLCANQQFSSTIPPPLNHPHQPITTVSPPLDHHWNKIFFHNLYSSFFSSFLKSSIRFFFSYFCYS